MDTIRVLPNELWICVFEHIHRSCDLSKIIQTSQHFYALGIRVLYRDIHYMGPQMFAQNIQFWAQQSPTMASITRSLTIGMSRLSSDAFNHSSILVLVDADGTWKNPSKLFTEYDPYAWKSRKELELVSKGKTVDFYASAALYEAMAQRITAFTMLRELLFENANPPRIIYDALPSLRNLRHLGFQDCTLPWASEFEPSWFSSLPITELTLRQIKGDRDHGMTGTRALLLATANNLRILRVDWTTHSARFFTHGYSVNEPLYNLPTGLEHLELGLPDAKNWPTELDTSLTMLLNPLVSFLTKYPQLRRLSLLNKAWDIPLSADALPNLNFFTGPLGAIPKVLKGRPVKHLVISDTDRPYTDYTRHFLPRLGKIKPGLETIFFTLRKWDNEILYPLVQILPDLQTLSINYELGGPSEHTLLSLGAHFLYRLPRLRTLRLSQVCKRDSSELPERFTDEDFEDFLAAWRKHCWALREVQFVPQYVWRRAFDGDRWCKRKLDQEQDSSKWDIDCCGI